MRYYLLLISTLVSPFSQASDYSVYYQQTVQGYAGPMALLELANNWHGKLRNEDDGILFQQSEVGFSAHNIYFSRIKRLHAEYQMPIRAAEIFYLFNRDIALDSRLETRASLKARDYRGDGFKLGYQLNFDQLNIKPHISWLKLNDIIWGSWSGDFSYQSRKVWDINVDVDYHYTEDKLIRRGTAPGRPLSPGEGDMLSLGLELEWRWHNYHMHYQGENLAAQINWKNLPATEAKVSTQGAFFILGYEFDEDKKFTPPKNHMLRQSLTIAPHWAVSAQSWLNNIRPTHAFGAEFQQPGYRLKLLRQIDRNVWTAGFYHSNIQMELQTGNLNVSHSRFLQLSLGVQLTF